MLTCYGLNSTLLPCLLGFMASLEAVSSVLIRKNKVRFSVITYAWNTHCNFSQIKSGIAVCIKTLTMAVVAVVYLPWSIVYLVSILLLNCNWPYLTLILDPITRLPTMDSTLFHLLLIAVFMSCVSSLICIYASKHFTKESFALMLFAYSLCESIPQLTTFLFPWQHLFSGVFFCEVIMKFHDLCPSVIMSLASIAAVYLAVRYFGAEICLLLYL